MDDFMGGGTKSAKFEQIGDSVTGVVISGPEKLQQTDFEGKPRFFDNGQPRWMYRIQLQTELRDPTDPYDDGVRSIYVKWKSQEAIQQAVRASGARTVEPGGILTLTFSGVGVREKGMPQPPKMWTAQYVPPQGEFMTGGAETPAAPVSPVPSAPAPATHTPAQKSILERLAAQRSPLVQTSGAPATPSHHAQGDPPF